MRARAQRIAGRLVWGLEVGGSDGIRWYCRAMGLGVVLSGGPFGIVVGVSAAHTHAGGGLCRCIWV